MIFAPERMIRLDLLTLNADVERLTGLLAAEGSIHVIAEPLPGLDERMDSAAALRSHREELERLRGLGDELLRLLDLRPRPVGDSIREAFLSERRQNVCREGWQALQSLRTAIEDQLRQRKEVEGALRRLDEWSEQMHLLDDHGLSFQDLRGFRHVHAVCGTVERMHAERLENRLVGKACAVAMRPAHGHSVAFLLMGDRDRAEAIEAILTDVGARMAHPPDRFAGSFDEGLEQVEIELWQQRDRLAELTRSFEAARAEWHDALSVWRARLDVHILLDETAARLGSDGTIARLAGFVPVSRRANLVARLEREAAGRYFARFEPAVQHPHAPPPTRLRNRGLFRPFELFVRTYGLPGYNDIDPTPFVALSFLAMFGMMFGDVGHGLVLAAIGAGMALLPYRLFLPVRDLGRILTAAGLAGMLFGFLFGSVFGVEDDAVLPALWMRPSHPENLTTFLGAALGLGVAVLSGGILLNIVQALRRGNLRSALLGQWSAASLIFFWGLLVLFGMRLLGRELPLSTGMLTVLLALPLCLIAGAPVAGLVAARRSQRRSGPDADANEPEAVEEEDVATILFEPIEVVMNLFTNSVSFLRVAAFGLAHAALTMAVFVVNDMVRLPGSSLVSLPFEHLFIIVLEGMIVTIQCLRLEYYEFFSKFFVGDGVAYAPLTIRTDDDGL